jgi:hypothetical protein
MKRKVRSTDRDASRSSFDQEHTLSRRIEFLEQKLLVLRRQIQRPEAKKHGSSRHRHRVREDRVNIAL